MFKCIHVMSPSYLSDCITMYNEIAVRDTRAPTSSNLVTVPHAPLALFETCSLSAMPFSLSVMSLSNLCLGASLLVSGYHSFIFVRRT